MIRAVRPAALALALAACAPAADAPRDPIVIGLVTNSTGALQQEGVDWTVVAQLAVEAINDKGGVNGHPLQLVVANDETREELSPMKLQELIDQGAVAAVGPGFSGAAALDLVVANQHQVPIVSPASTSPRLDTPDRVGGFLFRDVPNDSIQSVAMARFLQDEHIGRVAIVFEDTSYGQGLRDSFAWEYASHGGGQVDAKLAFAQNLSDANPVVDDMVAHGVTAGSVVVLISLEEDALSVVRACEARGLAVRWMFTDGERSAGFVLGVPESLVASGRILGGSAATQPVTGEAYGVLNRAYQGKVGAHDPLVYSSNVWDAVYLIGAALAQQEHDHPGEPPGGAHLRDAITAVSREGQIYHAGQWRDMLASIRAGGDVDYDGASGPVDFNPRGETISPYEIWNIADDAQGHHQFVRVKFYEAAEIQPTPMP